MNGTLLLDDYDIVASVGEQTGTMRTRSISAAQNTGQVTIDFGHVVENPLINGIEIIDNDFVARHRRHPGRWSSATSTARRSTPTIAVISSPLDFNTVRGATLIGGTLFYGKSDAKFYRRTFDGTDVRCRGSSSTRTTIRSGPTWTPAPGGRSAARSRRSTARSRTSRRCSTTARGSSTTRCSATAACSGGRSARTAGSSRPAQRHRLDAASDHRRIPRQRLALLRDRVRW